MSLEIISTIEALSEIKDEWNSLTDEPLRSFEWSYSWWEQFGAGNELRVYCLRNGEELIGIAPFFIDNWVGQKRIRFIGSGDTCTDYADLICDAEIRADFIEQIIKDVESQSIDLIELEGVTNQDAQAIADGFTENSYWQYDRKLEPTWILELPDSWEAFLSGSKKSLKRKIKKANSRLDSDEISVRSTEDDLGFNEAFEVLVELHQDRFKSKGEPGVFADPRFYAFLKSAAQQLAEKNKVKIVVAYENDEPFIAQIYLISESGPQLYQAGIRSSKMHLEPGHLLLAYSVRKSIQSGAKQFDFLRGDQPYKPYWGAKPCSLAKIRLVSRGLIPTAVNHSYRFLREMKKICSSLTSGMGMRFEECA